MSVGQYEFFITYDQFQQIRPSSDKILNSILFFFINAYLLYFRVLFLFFYENLTFARVYTILYLPLKKWANTKQYYGKLLSFLRFLMPT